ncbi:MAG: MFS transporter [Anaerolineae bacterium]
MCQPQTGAATTTVTEIEPVSDGRIGMFAILRLSSFAWFLTGSTLINGAYWIQGVTLSWLVYDLTSSGAMLGTLSLVGSLATLGLATIAGVAIDRLPWRGLLYATSIWQFIICLGFGLLLLGDLNVVWPLLLYSFLGGVGRAVSIPLRQTVLFSIVPRSLSPSAVALVQTGWAIMRSVGPAIGGFLILWFGPSGNFFVQAVAYALVTLTILKLELPREKPTVDRSGTGGGFCEGWTYAISEPMTRTFILMGWVLPLFIIPNFGALPPIYAKDVFEGGPDTLGILLSAVGVGGIVGGFVTASLGNLERRGLLQLAALLCLGLSFTGFALSSALWMGIIFMALAGFCEMIYLTTNQTLLQLSIPDALRGRVTGIVSLNSGLMPVGAYIAGIGADLVGPRAMTLMFSGIIVAIAVIVYFASPVVREYRLSQATEGRYRSEQWGDIE